MTTKWLASDDQPKELSCTCVTLVSAQNCCKRVHTLFNINSAAQRELKVSPFSCGQAILYAALTKAEPNLENTSDEL